MELRHLRYFVAVADAGSLTVAAEQKLHTSQPSLSRQIRDLEQEVGVELMHRSAHGVELTSAGKAFLDHARMALVQAEAAKEAALRAAQPARPTCSEHENETAHPTVSTTDKEHTPPNRSDHFANRLRNDSIAL